jgi:hypothetical protein
VSVESVDAAMNEQEFWIAWRDVAWNDEYPPLKIARARGYEIVRRFEFDAAGQKAFVALARRR